MPMLHPCPRCTQALPASAKFCRRCGAAIGAMVSAPVPPETRAKSGSLLSAGLTALGLAGAVVVGFFFLGLHHTQWQPNMAQPPIAPPAQTYVTDAPAPPSYPAPPTYVAPGNLPPRVIFVPGYQPPRTGEPEHERSNGNGESWDRRQHR